MNKFKVIIFSFILVVSGLCSAGPKGYIVTRTPDYKKKVLIAKEFEKMGGERCLLDNLNSADLNAVLSKLAEKYGDDPDLFGLILRSYKYRDIPAQAEILADIYNSNTPLKSLLPDNYLTWGYERDLSSLRPFRKFEERYSFDGKTTRNNVLDLLDNYFSKKKESMEDRSEATKNIILSAKKLVATMQEKRDEKGYDIRPKTKLFSDENIYRILEWALYTTSADEEKVAMEIADELIATKIRLRFDVIEIDKKYNEVKRDIAKAKPRDLCNERLFAFYKDDSRIKNHGNLDNILNIMIEDGYKDPRIIEILFGSIKGGGNFKDGLIYQIQEDHNYDNSLIKNKILELSLLAFSTISEIKIDDKSVPIEAILAQAIQEGNLKSFFFDLSELNNEKITTDNVKKDLLDRTRDIVKEFRVKYESDSKDIK